MKKKILTFDIGSVVANALRSLVQGGNSKKITLLYADNTPLEADISVEQMAMEDGLIKFTAQNESFDDVEVAPEAPCQIVLNELPSVEVV